MCACLLLQHFAEEISLPQHFDVWGWKVSSGGGDDGSCSLVVISEQCLQTNEIGKTK